MFKNILNDIKLNKISYLLEVIETGDFKKKVDAYNKLRKKKLDEESGHIIIDKVSSLEKGTIDDFNIEISLLTLLFKNYYDSYSDHLFEIYKKLNTNTKYELLNLLSTSDEPTELILYRRLISNYYKELDSFPIGNISANKDNYSLLFPELYETFKTKKSRNNILLLLNDFINYGVVPINHLKKYKTSLQKIIINIFKETSKYKIDSKTNFMGEKEYIDLRIFAEVAINIEYYISNKDTQKELDKLFKTKDNQLKLFVLENYARKDKNLSKYNINSIARDNLSRYPLFTFLTFNNAVSLMPKKYANNKALSLSDLYINYSIQNGYSKVPYDFKLLEERIIDNYKYYIYEFKTPYNYKEEVIDPATDYLLKNIKIDKELIEKGETTYIGISGGYNKDIDPSLIEKELTTLRIAKYDDDYEKIVNKLLKDVEVPKVEEKETKVVQEEKVEEKKPNILRRIFSFSKILGFFSIITVLAFVVLVLYVSNVDLFNLRKNTLMNSRTVYAEKLIEKDTFSEINYRDIFNKEEKEYYVLFFKKKKKSTYYKYLNNILKNDYKIYYVDLSKEDNKPIFEGNETGFVIAEDTLLKVTDREYSFFIKGKDNIMDEFKEYNDEILEKEKEKLEEERKEKKERESINVDEMLPKEEMSTEEVTE